MPEGIGGRRGEGVRSDCYIAVEPRDSGGIDIALMSKVKAMYGGSIIDIVKQGLEFYGIDSAAVEVEDQGALPFTIMARLETAVKRLNPSETREFLPEMEPECLHGTERGRMRRSRLYLPGNETRFMMNAGLHKPDGVILDLEDSVHPSEKDAARILVRNALRQIDFFGAERMVRINQGELAFLDLESVVPHNVHVVLIPKCETGDQVRAIDEKIQTIRKEHGIENEVYLMPIVESGLGAINAYEIASASPNNVGLTIGLEDYTADIGTRRTPKGRESFWARSAVVNAARGAGIQPIDTVFSDVSDMEGLRKSVLEAKSLGFDGKGCIHPRQIKVIHEAFAPEEAEVERARKIVLAFEEAEKKHLGVVSLGSKMIDPPVVKRALHTVDMAIAAGVLNADWRGSE
jgi:citrate lyase subunit beta/citryl-CoA lyase